MTHNERVLELLSDGKPHSHHEIYALYVIGHSRIADLRKQGYRINQWRDGDDYWYQLLEPLYSVSVALMEADAVQLALDVPVTSYEREQIR